jgi:hypothetical protein
MKGKQVESGPEGLPYKMEIQKNGLTLPGLPKGVPSNPNPHTHTDPGLGAKTLPHPFKGGKPTI